VNAPAGISWPDRSSAPEPPHNPSDQSNADPEDLSQPEENPGSQEDFGTGEPGKAAQRAARREAVFRALI
jgi:hypothetical protein